MGSLVGYSSIDSKLKTRACLNDDGKEHLLKEHVSKPM